MKLERILSGEPLTCIRVTPRQASLRGSWTSLPCLLVGVAPVPCQENHNYINHNFHIIHHIHSFLYYFPLGSILFRNWNQSIRIFQTQVMAFSCQLVGLPILPRDRLKYLFSSALSRYLALDPCTLLKIRC